MTKGFIANIHTAVEFQEAISKLNMKGISSDDIFFNITFEEALALIDDNSTLIVITYCDISGDLSELLTKIITLTERGITLHSIEEPYLHVTIDNVENIKNLISLSTKLRAARTKIGLSNARKKGIKLGRPLRTAKPNSKILEVTRLRETQGLSVAKACEIVGCQPRTYYRHIEKPNDSTTNISNGSDL